MRTIAGLRREKKEQTRIALQEAALELFEQHGFAAASVEKIAGRAGVSPRSFFRYFAHKEDPVFAEAYTDCERLVAAISTAAAGAHGEAPFDLLKIALPRFADTVDQPIAARRYRLMARDPTLRPRALEVREEWANAAADAFAQGRGEREPQTADRTAGAIGMVVFSIAVGAWLDAGAAEGGLSGAVESVLALLPKLLGLSPVS